VERVVDKREEAREGYL